jgi:hypothetical protein
MAETSRWLGNIPTIDRILAERYDPRDLGIWPNSAKLKPIIGSPGQILEVSFN